MGGEGPYNLFLNSVVAPDMDSKVSGKARFSGANRPGMAVFSEFREFHIIRGASKGKGRMPASRCKPVDINAPRFILRRPPIRAF